ncbi:unnamed protein product, partial [Ectocarpus sp. 12 AP-2014]
MRERLPKTYNEQHGQLKRGLLPPTGLALLVKRLQKVQRQLKKTTKIRHEKTPGSRGHRRAGSSSSSSSSTERLKRDPNKKTEQLGSFKTLPNKFNLGQNTKSLFPVENTLPKNQTEHRTQGYSEYNSPVRVMMTYETRAEKKKYDNMKSKRPPV